MVRVFAKTFRLGKTGHYSALGELEKKVMDVLWEKHSSTGKEVFEELRRTKEIAVTTVLTVLERLAKKGLIKRERGDGSYVFNPVCSKEEFLGEVSKEVIKGAMELSMSSTIASFVDILAKTDANELERLSHVIEEKKKELKTKRT